MKVTVVRRMARVGTQALLLGLVASVVLLMLLGVVVVFLLFRGSPVLQLLLSHLKKEK